MGSGFPGCFKRVCQHYQRCCQVLNLGSLPLPPLLPELRFRPGKKLSSVIVCSSPSPASSWSYNLLFSLCTMGDQADWIECGEYSLGWLSPTLAEAGDFAFLLLNSLVLSSIIDKGILYQNLHNCLSSLVDRLTKHVLLWGRSSPGGWVGFFSGLTYKSKGGGRHKIMFCRIGSTGKAGWGTSPHFASGMPCY